MPKANLKRKPGHAICAVIEPKPDPTRHWREVPGVFMEADSQDNINTWWDVFTEIAEGCADWKRQRIHRHGNR